MHYSKKRTKYGYYDNSIIVRYKSIYESICDFVEWQKKNCKRCKDKNDYLRYLQKYYSKNDNYVKVLLGIKISNNLENINNSNIYHAAKDFVLQFLSKEYLEQQVSPPPMPKDFRGIYRQMLFAAQNRPRTSAVIGGAEGINALKSILCGFEPSKIIAEYADANAILSKLIAAAGAAQQKTWQDFARTVIDAAKFLAEYKTPQDFYDAVGGNDYFPEVIAEKVHGLGFALACDFLKETGFDNYGKPDRHVKDILSKVKLLPDNPSDKETLDCLRQIAKASHTTPYAVDKVLWFAGSGKFMGYGNSKKCFLESIEMQCNDKKNIIQTI